jgi:hypothetical protein
MAFASSAAKPSSVSSSSAFASGEIEGGGEQEILLLSKRNNQLYTKPRTARTIVYHPEKHSGGFDSFRSDVFDSERVREDEGGDKSTRIMQR